MKNLALMIALLTGSLALSTIPAESKAQQVNVNFSLFYNELGRYGTWVNSPRYGGQVWIYREAGFRPYYSRGSWQYTDMGWAWASDYDWGWAPFHYGRWEYDDYYGGWIWIPGYEWAPAWVSWSESGDYYGWAPLGYGINININIGSIPYDRWVFCSRPYMNTARFYDHCAPFSQNRTIIKNYTIINNVYGGGDRRYYGGPGRQDYERYSRTRIAPRNIDGDRRFRNRSYGNDNNRDYSGGRREERYEPNNRVDRNNMPDRERRYDMDNRRGNDRGRDIGQQRDNNRTPHSIDRRENNPGSAGNGNGNNNRNNDWRRERPETNRNMREGNPNRGGNIGQERPSREQGRYEQPQQQPSQQQRQRGFEQRQPEYRGNPGNGNGRGQQRVESRGPDNGRGQGNGGNGNGRNGRRG